MSEQVPILIQGLFALDTGALTIETFESSNRTKSKTIR